ncbi:MAG: ROK family protein [Clostridia bacterium]|nr:ROK family protein [Clostridia bacterium]
MYRIGIDLGGINVACGLVTDGEKIILKKSRPTWSKGKKATDVAAVMCETALDLIKDAGLTEDDISLIGIGIPGAVDRNRGFVIRTANVPLDGFDLAGFFKQYTKIPIKLDNDANCAALGEALVGAGRGKSSSLTFTLGTGVGGGIIIDGKIYSGFNHAGGEVGHMVTHVGGRKCGCGRRGCFEAYASATAIIHDAKNAAKKHPETKMIELAGGDINRISGRTVFDAKDLGDVTAIGVVNNYIKELSEGIANYINIFQPETIILGGGISNQKEKLLVPLRKAVFEKTYGANLLPRTEIVCATLGNDAGIIGAALLG